MADSSESKASQATSEELLAKLVEKFDFQLQYLDTACEKLSNIELRQSRTAGEVNDSIRAVQQWANAESSCITSQAIKTVVEMQASTKTKQATYYEAFVQKDERRCEYELWKFYQIMVCKNDYVASDSQHSTGECFKLQPSVIRKLNLSIAESELDEMIPETLKMLHKLTMPLNRAYEPMTIQKMIELHIVPKNYKAPEQLTEVEAKKLWASVKAAHPECEIIDAIPINELGKQETWHQQLMRRVVEHNRFKKKVHLAEGTCSWETEEQLSAEEVKQAKQKHQKALKSFWSKHEPGAVLAIERAEKVKKKRAKEAAVEKAKRAKIEEAKEKCPGESEGEQ